MGGTCNDLFGKFETTLSQSYVLRGGFRGKCVRKAEF